MNLYGLRRSLFTRLPGILLLWLLAWSVAVAYTCSPQVQVGEAISEVILAEADESPAQHPESCDDHSPGITANLGKLPVDDLRNLPTSVGLAYGLFAISLLLVPVGGGPILAGLPSHSTPPVYLATARLRI
ncbi:MAG: hypothetical protein LPK08_08580 [Halomonas sp.]|nr:hypothetical protein [Halomonas sp.]